VKPRRRRVFGVPNSIIHSSRLPSGLFTSMWIHAWGLIHSIFVTVPFRITCFLASYSAANAWCADAGTIMPIQGSIRAAATTAPTLGFLPISFIPVLLC